MHTYWIVAPNEAQTTEYEHHYSREHARELAEEEGGVAARPVREDVMSGDAEVCSECSPLESASDGDTSESSENTGSGSGEESGGESGASDADLVERGECPWCQEYEGEYVGQHASSAHPDEWDEYNED